MQLETGVKGMIAQGLRGTDFDCSYSWANSEDLCSKRALVETVMELHIGSRYTIPCKICLHLVYAKSSHIAPGPELVDNCRNSD